MGRKIEIRWWTEVDGEVDGEGEAQTYLHCYEGTIKEIIPYTPARKNYAEFRLCKDPVAMVEWDEEFNMKNSPVPLNEKKYAKENVHCGWNIVRDDFARYIAEAANIQSMLQTGKGLNSGTEKGANVAMADANQDSDSD